MKRWMHLLAALAVCAVCLPSQVQAEDKPLSLTVTDEEGEEYDLIEEAGGDALVVFVDPAKFEEDDAKDLTEALNKIAEGAGDEGAEEEAGEMAALGGPRAIRLADDDDDAEEEEDGIEVVVVVLTDDEDAFGEVAEGLAELDCAVVMADPKAEDEELKAFELPENLVWAAYLVLESQVADGWTSVKELEGDSKEICDKLNKDDEVEDDEK